jgi:hypothetical protein
MRLRDLKEKIEITNLYLFVFRLPNRSKLIWSLCSTISVTVLGSTFFFDFDWPQW